MFKTGIKRRFVRNGIIEAFCALRKRDGVMKNKVEDRRIRKTRKLLHDALVSLILEKDYDSIIVQEIIDRANVGRSTFYQHFEDKDGLLASGIAELGENLQKVLAAKPVTGQKPAERLLGFSLFMFEHARDHRSIYLALGVRKRAFIRQALQDILEQVIKVHAKPVLGKAEKLAVPFDLFVYFLASSFLSVMLWWVEQKNPLQPKEIDKMFRAMVMPSVVANLK